MCHGLGVVRTTLSESADVSCKAAGVVYPRIFVRLIFLVQSLLKVSVGVYFGR